MIKPGTRPNEITSQSESSCLPISEVALNARATMPSMLSKKTPTKTHINVINGLFSIADIKAKQPENPFNSVSVFGMYFTIFINKDLV